MRYNIILNINIQYSNIVGLTMFRMCRENMSSSTDFNCSSVIFEDDCSLTNSPTMPSVNTTPAISLSDRITMDSETNMRTDSVTSSTGACRRLPVRIAAGISRHLQRTTVCCARFSADASSSVFAGGAAGESGDASDGVVRCVRRRRWLGWNGGRVGGSGCNGTVAKKAAYELPVASWAAGMHMSE